MTQRILANICNYVIDITRNIMDSEYRYHVQVGDVVLWRKKVWVVVDIERTQSSIRVGLIRGATFGRFRWVRRVHNDQVNELDLLWKAAYVPVHRVVERG